MVDIVATGSQHERAEDHEVYSEPSEEVFSLLQDMDPQDLGEMGLQLWSEESGLWLLPQEWYDHIPEGETVVSINGNLYEFPDGCEKEARFGALPYGIIRGGIDESDIDGTNYVPLTSEVVEDE